MEYIKGIEDLNNIYLILCYLFLSISVLSLLTSFFIIMLSIYMLQFGSSGFIYNSLNSKAATVRRRRSKKLCFKSFICLGISSVSMLLFYIVYNYS